MLIDYKATIDHHQDRPHIGARVVTYRHRPAKGKHTEYSHIFRPGVNVIDDKVWEHLQKAPAVRLLQDRGELVELDPNRLDVSMLPASEAIDLISRTSEPEILRAWQEQLDTAPKPNKTAQKVLAKQIEAVGEKPRKLRLEAAAIA